MAAFSYDRLRGEDREIRLVRFSDTNLTASTELEFVMERASLNEPPPYHALSYVWGDPTPTGSIRVNGKNLPVTNNLHEVLSQLHRGGDTRDYNSDLVMQMVQRIGPEAHEAGVADLWADWQSFSYGAKRPQKDPERKKYTQLVLSRALDDEELRSRRLLKAMERLLMRENWCRAWIVQEIALARDGLVLCGAERVSLDAFDAALSVIFFCKNGPFARQHPQWRDFGNTMGLNNNTFCPHGLVARRQRGWGHQAGLLEFLLSDFLAAPGRPFYMASDPRDIIFGFLGIATDTELLGLRPDYSQTVSEVYAAATRAILERCPDSSLDHCTFPKDIHDLPSWVPDWQRIGQLGQGDGFITPLSYYSRFTSSGSRVQPPSPASLPHLPHMIDGIPSWRVLRQRGYLVDHVTSVLLRDDIAFVVNQGRRAVTLSDALDTKGDHRLPVLKLLLSFATATCPTFDGPRLEAILWRTLVTDWLLFGRCTPEYDALAQQIFRQQTIAVETLPEAQAAYLLHLAQHIFRHSPPVSVVGQINVDELAHCVLGEASLYCRRRTVFLTVPIVLRPVADHFEFVGEAYVDGIMYGEFLEDNPPERDFDIA
ncbi:hypothetical protein C8A01DRAFT_49341 [Parachaetomium inaequale]|uniref:Heterokaryon incompatibility domain-containing protein n=1 Tax=Parachaetomium inaequale TaxID=2588326 RepID=A0AAN6SNW4_9PEZI|nr:hypothetical protein C8A01DRAFT_49341 [Parachaetomium inaequale]